MMYLIILMNQYKILLIIGNRQFQQQTMQGKFVESQVRDKKRTKKIQRNHTKQVKLVSDNQKIQNINTSGKFTQHLNQIFQQTSRKKNNTHRNKNRNTKMYKDKTSCNKSLSQSKRNIQSPQIQRLKTSIQYSQSIRKKNKKTLSHQSSHKNLAQIRMPWGVNQPKLNNYVMETLAKMQKIKSRNMNYIKQANRSQKNLNHANKVTPNKIKKYCTQFKGQDEQLQNIVTQKKGIINIFPQSPKLQKKSINQIVLKTYIENYQCLEKNSFLQLHFRMLKNSVIELQMTIMKKIQRLSVNLKKNSIECQSIQQQYHNIAPKTSIFLMVAVQGCKKQVDFDYPELYLNISEKSGTFGFQKNIPLPFSWIHMIQPLNQDEIKQRKTVKTKNIKNKSLLEGIQYNKKHVDTMIKIFDRKYLKTSRNKQITYNFWYKYQQNISQIRLLINTVNNTLDLQCETTNSENPAKIVQFFQQLLDF